MGWCQFNLCKSAIYEMKNLGIVCSSNLRVDLPYRKGCDLDWICFIGSEKDSVSQSWLGHTKPAVISAAASIRWCGKVKCRFEAFDYMQNNWVKCIWLRYWIKINTQYSFCHCHSCCQRSWPHPQRNCLAEIWMEWKWTALQPMVKARVYPEIYCFNNYVFVAGGNRGGCFDIECMPVLSRDTSNSQSTLISIRKVPVRYRANHMYDGHVIPNFLIALVVLNIPLGCKISI